MRAFHSTILFFTLSLFALNSSFAQGWQWSRHFGGPGHDYGQIGAVDAADNVYCFGTYGGSGPGQYHDLYIQNDTLRGSRAGFLTKHDGDGNLLWALNIISLNPDFGISVLSISMNVDSTALFITGAHSATCAIGAVVLADSGAYIAKVDPNGNCLWASNIGTSGTIGRKIIHNDLGEIFVSGVVPQSGTSFVGNVEIPPGAFLAKFAMDGTQIWAKSLISGLNSSNYPRYIPLSLKYLNGSIFAYGPCDASANGDPIIADTITVPVSYGVHALISVDGLNGVAQWIKTLPYSSTNYGFENRMTVGDSERIYCVGYTDGDTARFGSDTTIITQSGGISYFATYSSTGEFSRISTYDRYVIFQDIIAVDNNSFFILGDANNGSGEVNVCGLDHGLFVLRMDSMGVCKDKIETGYATGMNIMQTPQNIYIAAATPSSPQFNTNTFAGESVTSYGFEDVLLAKLDLSLGVQSLGMGGNDRLNIYANPNQGSFQIEVPNALVNSPHLELRIYDATGRMVLVQPMGSEDHPQFDLYGIGSGFYAVTLTDGRRVYHGNMVVE